MMFLVYLIFCFIFTRATAFEVISPEDVDKTNSTAAEHILDTLIQNNSLVNFAFQPNVKRNKTEEFSYGPDINDKINQRIKDLLDKRKVLKKNVTEPNVIWVQVKEVNQEAQPAKDSPEFFSNAYNRVMNLFSKTKKKSGESNVIDILERSVNATPIPDSRTSEAEIEITTEPVTDQLEISTVEYPMDSINEIAESLINFATEDKIEESTPSELFTTIQYLPIETLPAEDFVQQKLQTPQLHVIKPSASESLIFTSPGTLEMSTEISSVESRTETSAMTMPSTNYWTRFPTRLVTRTPQTRQTPSRWVLNTKAPFLMPRTTSQRPSGASAILQRLSTAKPDVALAPLGGATQTYTPEPERNTVGVDALNSVQSFLSQFGVSLKPTQVTRLPPWKTTSAMQDEKQAETSTIAEIPMTTMTSYWKRTTTEKPTQTPMNLIESELLGANPIEVDDNSTSLLKISLLTPGCHSEKSVLMLFNKNQRIQISIDTRKEEPEKDQSKTENIETSSIASLFNKPLVIKDDPMNSTNDMKVELIPSTTPVSSTKSTKVTRSTKAPQPKPTRVTVAKRTRTTSAPNIKRKRKPVVAIDAKNGEVLTTTTTTKKAKRKRTKSKKKSASKVKKSNITLTTTTTTEPISTSIITKVVPTTIAPKKRRISSKRIIATRRK